MEVSMKSNRGVSAFQEFHQNLPKTEPVYARLMELKQRGWENPQGDEHFENQRNRADNASSKGAVKFYHMMKEIGDEMQIHTGAFSLPGRPVSKIKILDLCMAPGGYTYSALRYNPEAQAIGITLAPEQGGYEVFLLSPHSRVLYQDITMFAAEFGVADIPATHPARTSFIQERPFAGEQFDLVICDGQVLRTHKRPKYRECREATRLINAQLILAMQRIREGGTCIILLHKIEDWDSMQLLYTFSRFADIQVFKPVKKHAIRSSFYLIAMNVKKNSAAERAVASWKKNWYRATFGGEQGTGEGKQRAEEAVVKKLVEDFGEEFKVLAAPIWRIQADALSRSDFVG